MLVYCKYCQNLVLREDECSHREGEVIELECKRCGRKLRVVVKYRPKCIDNYREGAKMEVNIT